MSADDAGPELRRRVALFAAFALLVVLTLALSLLLSRLIAAEQHRLAQIDDLRRTCEEAARPLTAAPASPADVPVSEPRGADAYLPRGADITPAMRLRLERLGEGSGQIDHVRLGAHEVLAPDSVHVLGLWAPWCGPCKHLLPRLREMFGRRAADWGGSVAFVPIQVRDGSSPEQSYATFGPLMPDARARLADRSRDDDLVELLREPHRALYTGNLPLTMLLDCNRRIRWAKEGTLTPAQEEDLERRIDEILAELRTGDPRCKQRWCGNGRCEPGESGRCEEDCEPALLVQPLPPAPCPADCLQCDERGRCLARQTGPARCGNGRCEPGENRDNCCRDCPCRSPFTCRLNADSRHVCVPPLLGPGTPNR
jgi:thiol-disulfide isomerase/thioredoxin